MLRSRLLWGIWLSFIVYLVWGAPPLPADALQPIQTLIAGQWPTINPVILSLFSLVGIWLLIYSCLVFPDGRMQSLPAWLFMLAAVATGVVALIPYLALRQPNQDFAGGGDPWLNLLDARSTGVILTLSTAVLLVFALAWGDWSGFVQEFLSNRFIHGMTLALILLSVLFPYPTLLQDDMVRRGLTPDSRLFWFVAVVPLLGPLVYLCVRPPLLSLRFRES
jgi:hypothetical protein